MEIKINQIYRHQNGLLYKIIDTEVWDGETDTIGILHKGLGDERYYFRSTENFCGELRGKPRFELKYESADHQ